MDDLTRESPKVGPRLTFGLGLFTGQNPRSAEPLYRQAPDLARAAEDAGFDTFWVSEHHGLDDGYLPAPLTLLAAVAARTSRIRLGTGLAIAPLYHPVRLAEEAAVVDQLSQGRLILGLGIGYAEHEFRSFAVDPARRGARLGDLLDFLRTAWQGETFTWNGPAYEGDGIRVAPRPASEAGIPLWLGGYAPSAVRRAGRKADGYLVGRGDPAIVAAADELLAEVRQPEDPGFTVGVNLIVRLRGTASDDQLFAEGFIAQQAAYERVQRGLDVFSGHVDTGSARVDGAGLDRYFHATGDTGDVVEQVGSHLLRLERWCNVHVVIRALVPQIDLREQLGRIERLGTEVLPALRAGQHSAQPTT